MRNNKHCHPNCGRYFPDRCRSEHRCDFDPCDFIRCSPLQERLAGLQGNLNFLLFRLKGCRVRIHFECASMDNHVTGRICNVTNETVDIREDNGGNGGNEYNGNNNGGNGGRVVTIMLSRICKIEWLDEDCNPCMKHNRCDCGHVCN